MLQPNVAAPSALYIAKVQTMKAGGLHPVMLEKTHTILVHQKLVSVYLHDGEDAWNLASILPPQLN